MFFKRFLSHGSKLIRITNYNDKRRKLLYERFEFDISVVNNVHNATLTYEYVCACVGVLYLRTNMVLKYCTTKMTLSIQNFRI